MRKNEKLTWGELKSFINELPENELKKKVNWWGDVRGGIATSVNLLDEDYIDMGEGYEPVSVYPESEYKEDLITAPRIKAGTPILHID